MSRVPLSSNWEERLAQCREALRNGRLSEGESLTRETYEEAQKAGLSAVACDAAVLLSKLKVNAQMPTEALFWAERALAEARNAQDSSREAVAWVLSASNCAEMSRPLEALRAAQRATSLTEQVKSPAHLQSLQTGLMITYNALGLSHLALTAARRAQRVAQVHASAADRVLLRWNLLTTGLKVYSTLRNAEPDRARVLLDEMVAEARYASTDPELSDSPALAAGCCSVAGEVLEQAGLLDEALHCLERGVAAGFEDFAEDMMHRWHCLSRVQRQRGCLEASEVAIQRAREFAAQVHGQSCSADLPSRAEAAALLGDHAAALELSEQHHANSVGMLIAAFELRTAELVVDLTRNSSEIELAELRLHNRKLSLDVAHLGHVARSDALTALLNRGGLEEAFIGVRKQSSAFAVLLLDVDHFKRVNDLHSHVVGDAVLRRLGQTLAEELRSPDIVGRYGGEEFLALISGVDLAAARAVAERLRLRVSSRTWLDLASGLNVTISGGLVMGREVDDFTAAVERADSLLYQAKRLGRNRIVCEA